MLRTLKSSFKHRRKHVLRSLQLYGDQALESPQSVWGKNCISIPCFRIIRLENNMETMAYCSWTNIHDLFRNFYQFLYPVQEFRLKIDILKNGTSRICLYGSPPSPPPPPKHWMGSITSFWGTGYVTVDCDILPSSDMPGICSWIVESWTALLQFGKSGFLRKFF